MDDMDDSVVAFESALLAMDRKAARQVLTEVRERVGALASVERVLVAALEKIGSDWERGDIALSQVYMSGRICEELVESAFRNEHRSQIPASIGIAVFEDHHSLGKRIVQSVMRAAGFVVKDYGRLDRAGAMRCLSEDGLRVMCLSVLMLNSALHIEGLKHDIEQAGLGVKLVVGGAPFRLDDQLGREVGADGVGRSASDAISLVRAIIGGPACPQ